MDDWKADLEAKIRKQQDEWGPEHLNPVEPRTKEFKIEVNSINDGGYSIVTNVNLHNFCGANHSRLAVSWVTRNDNKPTVTFILCDRSWSILQGDGPPPGSIDFEPVIV